MKCFKLFCALHTKPNPWVFVIEEQLLFTCILYCIHPVTLLWPWVLEHFMMGMCGNSGYLRCVCVCVFILLSICVYWPLERCVCVYTLSICVYSCGDVKNVSHSPEMLSQFGSYRKRIMCFMSTATTNRRYWTLVWIWTQLNYCVNLNTA